MSAELVTGLAKATLLLSTAVLVVIALRPLWHQRFGARATTKLWLIVPLTVTVLVLPDRSAQVTANDEQLTIIFQLEGMADSLRQPLQAARQTFVDQTHPIVPAILVFWLAGFVCGLSILALRQKRLRLSLGTLTHQRHRLWICQRTDIGPLVMGILSPRIILPANFSTRFSSQQRHLMLRHEHAHLRRKDPLWNLVSLVFRCVFWFNPLAHWASALFRKDQEFACDEDVLADRVCDRRPYALALLSLADTKSRRSALAFGPHPLKERIMRIPAIQSKKPLQQKLALLATALLGTTLALSAWALSPSNSGPEDPSNTETFADWFGFDVEITVNGETVSGQLSMQGERAAITKVDDQFRMLARNRLTLQHDEAESGWSADVEIVRQNDNHFMVNSTIQFNGETVATPRMLIGSDFPASIEQTDPETGQSLYRLQLIPVRVDQLLESHEQAAES